MSEDELIKEGIKKVRSGETKRVDFYMKDEKITVYQCGSKVIRIDIKEN